MAAGPACRRFLADVYINRVSGAFFHAAQRKIFGSPKSQGIGSGKNFFRQPGLGGGPLPDGMYLRWTRDVPGPRTCRPAREFTRLPRYRPGGVRAGASPGHRAGRPSGTSQVHAGYMAGRRGGYRRSTGGPWGLAGWGFVPVRFPHLEPLHGSPRHPARRRDGRRHGPVPGRPAGCPRRRRCRIPAAGRRPAAAGRARLAAGRGPAGPARPPR
jgi:hypothetical protein